MRRQRNNYANDIKHSLLLEGRFVITTGRIGAGKTSLTTAMMSLDYKYHSKMRLRMAQSIIKEYNSNGGHLELPEHLYYSNIDICLTDPRKRNAPHTNFADINRFGIPNDDYAVQYFPPYSVIYFSEVDNWLNSHKWQDISAHVRECLKYIRKMHYTVIFDVQVFDQVAKQLRQLSTDIFSIRDCVYEPAKFFGLIKQREHWRFYWINPQEIEMQSTLEKSGITIPKSEIPKVFYKLTYKGNVFTQYDSYAERMYFFYRIDEEGYQAWQHPPRILSPSGVQEFCTLAPLPSEADD